MPIADNLVKLYRTMKYTWLLLITNYMPVTGNLVTYMRNYTELQNTVGFISNYIILYAGNW